MWQTPAERLALLELLVRGTLKKRRAQTSTWEVLAELPWVKRTGRRDEFGLVEGRRGELVSLLERVWPAWGDALTALTVRGLPPTPEGWTALEDATRAADLPPLPERLNRRTAAALVAPHSKAALTERRIAVLGDVEPMHDGSVRLRPPPGLFARSPAGEINLCEVAKVLGETSLPERSLRQGLLLEGEVRAILMVENIGAFCDIPHPEGWLIAHVPGWDTVTAKRLLDKLQGVPTIHFGDMDPNGVRIFHHLRSVRPGLRWFTPGFWIDYVERNDLRKDWPEAFESFEEPELLRKLRREGKWLEQESIVLDPRLLDELEDLLAID